MTIFRKLKTMKLRESIPLPGKSCAASERKLKMTQRKSKLTQNSKKKGLRIKYSEKTI